MLQTTWTFFHRHFYQFSSKLVKIWQNYGQNQKDVGFIASQCSCTFCILNILKVKTLYSMSGPSECRRPLCTAQPAQPFAKPPHLHLWCVCYAIITWLSLLSAWLPIDKQRAWITWSTYNFTTYDDRLAASFMPKDSTVKHKNILIR